MKNKLLSILVVFILIAGFLGKDTAAANSNISKPILPAKTYAQMSEVEKKQFVKAEADKILDKFGRVDGDEISNIGLANIKFMVDGYAKRVSGPKSGQCRFGDDLTTLLMRGGKYAKTINDEFTAAGLPPQIGIYTAMIESEYCPAIQSMTGPVGIFQFTSAMGKQYGLNTHSGATAGNPDDRFNPQLAARAAAKYMKFMASESLQVKMDAIGYPLVIGAYNSGEGAAKKHIAAVAAATNNPTVSFWTLLENKGKLADDPDYSEQFESENFKYVPKFFAAAIVGENPRVFGVAVSSLSESK